MLLFMLETYRICRVMCCMRHPHPGDDTFPQTSEFRIVQVRIRRLYNLGSATLSLYCVYIYIYQHMFRVIWINTKTNNNQNY